MKHKAPWSVVELRSTTTLECDVCGKQAAAEISTHRTVNRLGACGDCLADLAATLSGVVAFRDQRARRAVPLPGVRTDSTYNLRPCPVCRRPLKPTSFGGTRAHRGDDGGRCPGTYKRPL